MRNHRALRLAGRARGEHDVGGVRAGYLGYRGERRQSCHAMPKPVSPSSPAKCTPRRTDWSRRRAEQNLRPHVRKIVRCALWGSLRIDEIHKARQAADRPEQRVGRYAFGQLQGDDIALGRRRERRAPPRNAPPLLHLAEETYFVPEDQCRRGWSASRCRERVPKIGHQRRRPPSSFTIVPLTNVLRQGIDRLDHVFDPPRRPSGVCAGPPVVLRPRHASWSHRNEAQRERIDAHAERTEFDRHGPRHPSMPALAAP